MASTVVGNVAKTATLAANTADTVTFNPPAPIPCEVVNLDSSSVIWMDPGGVNAATVGGADCIPIPPNSSFIVNGGTSISLISAGAPQYCVNRIV